MNLTRRASSLAKKKYENDVVDMSAAKGRCVRSRRAEDIEDHIDTVHRQDRRVFPGE